MVLESNGYGVRETCHVLPRAQRSSEGGGGQESKLIRCTDLVLGSNGYGVRE